MADGNFNTKILVPGGYASGVRAGEARMKQRAITIFSQIIKEQEYLTEEQQESLKRAYKQRLDESIVSK